MRGHCLQFSCFCVHFSLLRMFIEYDVHCEVSEVSVVVRTCIVVLYLFIFVLVFLYWYQRDVRFA